MVLVRKSPFFQLFFLGSIAQENVFYDILEKKKTPFQAIKTRSSKSRKIDIFSKQLTFFQNPWFWSKNGHFSKFFFQAVQARKMSFTIFQRKKTPFQPIKTRSSKSRKIGIFQKGLSHGFGPKVPIFSTFFFSQYIQGNFLLGYSKRKKTPFQPIKTRS